MTGTPTGSFALVFSPSVDLISVVRRFVGDFYRNTLGPEIGEQLALATHELLENSVKYGDKSETKLCIDVWRQRAERHVVIRTQNQALAEHVEVVRALVERLRAGSPFDFYQVLMRESLASPNRSGLGLARIAAEADMALSCHVEGAALTIQAECRLPVAA
jgi:two-component sensor histidine kinase